MSMRSGVYTSTETRDSGLLLEYLYERKHLFRRFQVSPPDFEGLRPLSQEKFHILCYTIS